jgi:hypothetical protein
MAMRITSARYHSLAWMASCDPTWFRAGRIASNGGPHAGRQGRLHLGGGGLAEYVGHVPGPAAGALDVLADRVERDDRQEEQREPPPPGPVAVLPVSAAAAAVEGALRERPEEHAKSEDDQQRGSPSA